MQGDSMTEGKGQGRVSVWGWGGGAEEGLGQGELRGGERTNGIACEEVHE